MCGVVLFEPPFTFFGWMAMRITCIEWSSF